MTLWLLVLLLTALSLIIPATVLLGQRIPIGPVIVSSGASLGAFAVFWLFLGGTTSSLNESPEGGLVLVVTLLIGVIQLGVAWILALNTAAQQRRWGWVALLTLAGELSVAALLISIVRPDPCMLGDPSTFDTYDGSCPTSNLFAHVLILVGYLAGPVAASVYSLRSAKLQRSGPPEGLSVSSISAASDHDSEFEIGSERL